MSRQAAKIGSGRPIRFVDAFAGPGVFKLGNTTHPGSPIRSLQSIAQHTALPVPINMHFIEQDVERYQRLTQEISAVTPSSGWPKHMVVHAPMQGECTQILRDALSTYDAQRKPFGPALIFLDQFGYGSVPMDLVAQILSHPQCEVFTFIEAGHLNRFLEDPTKDSGRTAAFGGEEWKGAVDEPTGRRSLRLRKIYRENMKKYGGASLVWDFVMLNESGTPVCWLFFGTNSDRGLEVMKTAMRRVSGQFAYADGDSMDQITLFKGFDEECLANDLADHFAGEVVTVGDVRLYVLEHTPMVKHANTMKTMRKQGKLKDIGTPKIAYSKSEQWDRKVSFEPKSMFGS